MNILELRQKRASLAEEAAKLIPASGPMAAESREKFEKIHDEIDELKKTIDAAERQQSLDAELRDTTRPPESQVGDKKESRELDKKERKQLAKRASRAFSEYLRSAWSPSEERAGLAPLSNETREFLRSQEYRDMGIGSPTASIPTSVLVPQGFYDSLEVALKWYGDMLSSSKILETATGQPLPYPTENDTTTVGAIIGEGAQVSEADVTVANIVFGAYKYTTNMVKVSLELLQDSAFDPQSFLTQAFAIRLGRILNTHFTVGTGSSQPTGILTAATAGPTATGSASNDGGAETGGTSIGSDDLIELEHSVDKAYRKGASFMAHDLTLKTIKKLKDKYGRPLWLPGISSDAPDTILGYRYFTNNDLPTIAVNAKTVLFGQLDKYMIRRVKDLSVLRLVERFADYGQVAFLGFARYDGNLLDAGTHPVKYLVQAAS